MWREKFCASLRDNDVLGTMLSLESVEDVNVYLTGTQQHNTPLTFAILRDAPVAVIECMLDKSADMEMRQKHFGDTPLHCAVKRGNLDVISLLASRGCDMNSKSRSTNTPLHEAVRRGNLLLVRVLLEHGAVPRICNGDNQTSIHLASGRGHSQVLRELLKYDPDLDAQDTYECTALHYACMYNYEACAMLLLDGGADTSIRNASHKTALDTAKLKNLGGIIRLFDRKKLSSC